ncbi:MAG: undecaprenyl-phosphate glucose phosphotransferase [Alphaproteobacteria bacterium]|nr:undecaprenyl-phosphate glucose phosphotransferase [Alphaproteobacteria bacterium]
MRRRLIFEGIGRSRRDWLLPGVVVGMLRLSDALTVILASLIAYITRFRDFDDLGTFQIYGCVIAVLLTINIFQLAGLYDFNKLANLYAQTPRLLGCWALVMIGLLALGFLAKVHLVASSRLWVAMWFGYGFVGFFAMRILLRHQIRRWQQAGRLARNVAIVGTGPHGKRLIEHMTGNRSQAERIVGVFTDLKRDADSVSSVGGYPVLGGIDDLVETARRSVIDQVIVALPCSAEQRILDLMKTLRSLPIDVRLCPDMIGFHLPDRTVSHVGGVPMLNVFEKPLTGWGLILKGMEDRVLAGLILLLISPLLLLITVLIKLDSRGPVLFRQKRYGFNNEVIEVLKFRSMYTDRCSPDSHVPQATKEDPRVTRVGRFLRRTSLDELPQFVNVLTGNMSIVGPRPHAVAHNEQYAGVIDQYLGRHRVKPGITGWAQVNGLRGETETLEKMEQRVRYDLYYIDNWSLLFDLRIIFRTLFVGFSDPNAY